MNKKQKKIGLIIGIVLVIGLLLVFQGYYISSKLLKSSEERVSTSKIMADKSTTPQENSKPDIYLIGTFLVVAIGYPSMMFLLIFSKGTLSRKSYYHVPYQGTKEEDTDINYNCISLSSEPTEEDQNVRSKEN